MCLSNCPCERWINCHYYNGYKYIIHIKSINNEIQLWYDTVFRQEKMLIDVIANG